MEVFLAFSRTTQTKEVKLFEKLSKFEKYEVEYEKLVKYYYGKINEGKRKAIRTFNCCTFKSFFNERFN